MIQRFFELWCRTPFNLCLIDPIFWSYSILGSNSKS